MTSLTMTAMVMAKACSILYVLLQLAHSASATYNSEDIFNPNGVWPDPDEQLERHILYGDKDGRQYFPKPWIYPFNQFGKDMELTYFTKQEYEVYGLKYWNSEEREAYQNIQYSFDYVIEKWLAYGSRLKWVRYLNYSNPRLATEKILYEETFFDLLEADQDQVLSITKQRMYRNYQYGCSIQYVKADFIDRLERQVMRHLLMSYDQSQRQPGRRKYTHEELFKMTQGHEFTAIIRSASDISLHHLKERERKRRCRYIHEQITSVYPNPQASEC